MRADRRRSERTGDGFHRNAPLISAWGPAMSLFAALWRARDEQPTAAADEPAL
jgi:hypothetical protein